MERGFRLAPRKTARVVADAKSTACPRTIVFDERHTRTAISLMIDMISKLAEIPEAMHLIDSLPPVLLVLWRCHEAMLEEQLGDEPDADGEDTRSSGE